MVSPEEIRHNILTNQAWLERAILAIYERQTNLEQKMEIAVNHNGVGFNRADASTMSYYARWIKEGHHLSGKHVDIARRRILKYSNQLYKIVQEKEEKKSGQQFLME